MSQKIPMRPKRQTNMDVELDFRVKPKGLSDHISYGFVKLLRFFADLFFREEIWAPCDCFRDCCGCPRYGWRIIITLACYTKN